MDPPITLSLIMSNKTVWEGYHMGVGSQDFKFVENYTISMTNPLSMKIFI